MAQRRYGNSVLGIAVIVVIAVIIIGLFSVRFVGVGEVGVINTFGVVDPIPKPQGLLVKLPWATLDTYSVRTQSITMSSRAEEVGASDQTVRTLTSEGLSVGLDITTLFVLNFDQAPQVRNQVGPEGVYQEIIVRPAIRNAIRDVVAQFTAEALYTTAREEIGSRIQNQLDSSLNERGVTIQDVLLRDVTLPAVITQAIENKLAAEQAIQERRFRVDEAKEEAQRRIEEANGIAEANRRINESLTAAVLQDKYIQALREMGSGSVVYVPTNPETGLPVILGTPELGSN
ncbi:MAG: prohibitin family protein [Chloroflexota bacterium]|nr:prohibitin family protein [Chloroflexota bacterium]